MTGYHQRDSTLDALLLGGILITAAVCLWFLWRECIIFLGFALSLVVVFPFAMLEAGLAWLDIIIVPLMPVAEVWQLLTREPWSNLQGYFIPVMTIGGRCLAILVFPSLVLGYLGSKRLRPDMVYRQRHDLESAIRELGSIWSCANWLTKVNPARERETAVPEEQIGRIRRKHGQWKDMFKKTRGAFPWNDTSLSGSWLLPTTEPPYQPPLFGRAMRPEEWLAAHGFDRNDVDLVVTVDMLLARQLQRKWIGWPALQEHRKALLAVLVLIDQGRTDEAEGVTDDLMNMMAKPGKGMDFARLYSERNDIRSRVQSILAEQEDMITGLAEGHFWAETVMAEAWIRCREGKGVWPSARFQWMKIIDRPLWYTISSLGSHAVFVECSGILAHHLAERQLEMPLVVPRVRRASEAIVYDYLDQSPERIKARSKREHVATRLVPGQIWRSEKATGEVIR